MSNLIHMPLSESENANTLEWTRPDQVMQLHRMKLKKRALQARINKTTINTGTQQTTTNLDELNSSSNVLQRISYCQKRKNPFAVSETCKKQKDIISAGLDISNDNTLFELLNMDGRREIPMAEDSSIKDSLTFANVLSKLESINQIPDVNLSKGAKHVPIDWTLKTKMRFMSLKPFPWNCKLKTSEEASGTTGFVRCLNIGEKETTLDTSPNARFHQCCLIWQHPSIPWLELFPRSANKVSASLANNALTVNNQNMKDALYREWCDSFRSLFHLLRARQCPYFYVCANTFTVLFRAAGICGLSEIHALVTPTTRGFRQSLKQEEIEYSMPLREDSKRRSDTTDSNSKTVDVASTKDCQYESDYYEKEKEEDDDETQDEWLESLGVENSEIKKINHSQARMTLEKESEVDNLKQSLVFVRGVETQALFNFLINFKSAIAATGALAGVPPTLLAPTAFHGATLKPLKVRESIVHDNNDRYYSLELRGPLLPHVLPSLCHLMKSSQLEQYSVSCAQLASTISFSTARHGHTIVTRGNEDRITKVSSNVFGQENLSDCGFNEELLNHFCNSDPTRIGVLDSLKFFNELYTWS
ncbi:Protein downstream neighbor of son like protein [Trachymyrmex zeteki]|uniref:Protein downstream neighbor of son like protein n=2 Tax=Mycetomoellerius zeteki TaxID=64791 RepID=A0A151WV18_9HYME|nr:PREDICTED: protein downstream neighbor of son homolog isoform X3 [Trachymyrmex zeteki]XP_018309127.1 PREDICTED: protein downstream neighbor of son homolog isoform X3 [Trachymyrmex zeteki]KYQ51495.1 Protein downstream neighbor of son like protein [Trachymyrmex zeteki]